MSGREGLFLVGHAEQCTGAENHPGTTDQASALRRGREALA